MTLMADADAVVGKLSALMEMLSLEGSVELADVMEVGQWVKPADDRVLAWPLEEALSDVRTPEGEVALKRVPSADEKPTKFLCVAIGPGGAFDFQPPVFAPSSGRVQGAQAMIPSALVRVAAACMPGDVFIAGRYVGQEQELDGREYRLIKASDVLAVLDLPKKADIARRAAAKADGGLTEGPLLKGSKEPPSRPRPVNPPSPQKP